MKTNEEPRRRALMLGGALCLLVALAAACEGPGAGKTAFVGATLWDGTGAPPILDAIVIVDGAYIDTVGPPDLVRVPRGAEVRRLDGKWIIPGMIDAHVRVAPWMLEHFLASGITAVRDMGNSSAEIAALRDSLALGTILGPRLYVSGAAIDAAPAAFPYVEGVRTPNDGRRAIDQRVLLEASHATIYPKITGAIFVELIDEARLLRLPVAGILGRVDAITAAREGIHSIEQLSGIVEAIVRDPGPYQRAHADFNAGWRAVNRGWAQLDSAALDRTARALAEAEVAQVPMLFYAETMGRLRESEFVDGLGLSVVPDSVAAGWAAERVARERGIGSADVNAIRRARPVQNLFLRRFHAAGGITASGSGAGYPPLTPGATLREELRMLAEAGLEPREVLLAATRNAAHVLQADSLGVVRPGSVADFVVLEASPIDDLANLSNIYVVVFRGLERTPGVN